MHFSQILIANSPEPISPYIKGCVEAIKSLYPEGDHSVYDNQKLVDFIAKNFDQSVVDAYHRLVPNAYKADLGRYCLLYVLGGWYFDIAIKPLRRIDLSPEVDLLAFRDIGQISQTSFSVSNGIIYAKRNNPIFKKAIEMVVANCRENYYGLNALSPTGPNLFGEAIALAGPRANNVIGDVQFLTPFYGKKNKAFVLPDGEIFSFFKPANGGDLVSLGVGGGNNYVSLYEAKQIYKT
jgi:mannosyltransferase OCH1-like enzyme